MSKLRPARHGKQAIVFIAITLLLDTIGFGLIIPVLPTLLAQITGEDVSHAAIHGGFLSFLYATMQFLWAPVLGNLSDRFGRRPVLTFPGGSLRAASRLPGRAALPGCGLLGR